MDKGGCSCSEVVLRGQDALFLLGPSPCQHSFKRVRQVGPPGVTKGDCSRLLEGTDLLHMGVQSVAGLSTTPLLSNRARSCAGCLAAWLPDIAHNYRGFCSSFQRKELKGFKTCYYIPRGVRLWNGLSGNRSMIIEKSSFGFPNPQTQTEAHNIESCKQ